MKTYLISIKNKHAEDIFSGTKKYEIRRRFLRLKKGDILFIYEPSPKMQITGFLEVDEVITKKCSVLWDEIKLHAGISEREYLTYLEGISLAIAIKISRAQKCKKVISLEEIRSKSPGFLPPQVYRSLDESLIKELGLQIQ